MSEQKEPFGYFRAEPFGWVDCGENDEGAVALYSQETVNALQEQRSTFRELAAFHRDARLGALKELAKVEKQRDELLSALESIGHKHGCHKNAFDSECTCGIDAVIASVKGGAE